uniref:Transposase n=1 Tax=Mesocestoides corti TaxID=53468 RepID=A0A5K3FW38_MESCO
MSRIDDFSWHLRVFSSVIHRRERTGVRFADVYAPSDVATVEYPSPNRKKNGITEQALLTNQKPDPHVRRLPSESATLATPLTICCSSV